LLARVLAYINAIDVVPGTVFLPDFFDALVSRYRFQQYPADRKAFDIEKGIEFTDGLLGNVAIERFVIWKNLLVLETRINTDASKNAIEDILQWGADQFAFRYERGDIKRFAYISDIAFHSEAELITYDPVLQWLSKVSSSVLTEIWQEPVEYRTTSIKIGHDPVLRHLGIAPFSLERRGQARFSDNEYFSEAPLPTNTHLELLHQFEARVINGSKNL
jgi:hypothetical protein